MTWVLVIVTEIYETKMILPCVTRMGIKWQEDNFILPGWILLKLNRHNECTIQIARRLLMKITHIWF